MSKLVRDKIPELFPDNTYRVASGEEYWGKLKEKLREEVEEYLTDETQEELADVHEVLDAIFTYKRYSKDAVSILQRQKSEKRGKFEKRIILER